MFLNFIKEFKAGLKTGNGIFQTGIGIISPIFLPLIKNLLLQNGSKFYQRGCKEEQCKEKQFQCVNKKCVADHWRYDYDNDCGDNSDEKDCPSTTCEAGSQFRCDWAVYQQQVEM